MRATEFARGIETYSLLSWQQFQRRLRVLRARKALANTRVLCVSRFGHDYSLHDANDSFVSLDKVTEVLGTKFRFANLHEVIDQIQQIDPTTNYTTPGRLQENINDEDMEVVNAVIDELVSTADPCAMDCENMVPSVKMYRLVQKLLAMNECNAFTANCPDACSTCRINKERFTFCITHSLNNEQGFPLPASTTLRPQSRRQPCRPSPQSRPTWATPPSSPCPTAPSPRVRACLFVPQKSRQGIIPCRR